MSAIQSRPPVIPGHVNKAHIQFASKLTLLKDEAFRLGLYRTGHLLEIPIQEVGWEMQGVLAPQEQKDRQQSILTP